MIYLDYSATTQVDDEVLESFNKACHYIGNPNSLHKLGLKTSNLIEASTKQILSLLGKDNSELIYTSGSSEANNLAIKGVCLKYQNRGKHIITTPFEHSSIYGPINYLLDKGFEVDFVTLDENGIVDIDDLKKIIRDDTILVSIGCVNSEIGIRQPIEKIGKLLQNYPKIIFHSDVTQAIGKVKVNLQDVDLASFSAHKFFGIKGIGGLVKNASLKIEPLIHGGFSTTIFRSGTPCTELIVSQAKALRLALLNIDDKINYVEKLNKRLKNNLNKYDKVCINSNDACIPHILNISILGVKPEVMLHALEMDDIYISTQSACSKNSKLSKAVLALTHSEVRASSSVRISISYKTTNEEIEEFLKMFDKHLKKLTNLR